VSATDVLVAGTGAVNIAPEGTPLPSRAVDVLDAAFIDVGFTTPDGVQWAEGPTYATRRPWGQMRPTLRLLAGQDGQVAFTLLEFSRTQLDVALGDGQYAQLADNPLEWSWDPAPPATSPGYKSLVVDAIDGEKHVRLVIARAQVVSAIDAPFRADAATALPVTVAALTSPRVLYAIVPRPPIVRPDPRLRALVRVGHGAPDAGDEAVGFDGLIYIDLDSGDVYRFSGTPTSPPDAHQYAIGGSGPPDSGDGEDGDTYLDAHDGLIYWKGP
jgi:hypothetical protein